MSWIASIGFKHERRHEKRISIFPGLRNEVAEEMSTFYLCANDNGWYEIYIILQRCFISDSRHPSSWSCAGWQDDLPRTGEVSNVLLGELVLWIRQVILSFVPTYHLVRLPTMVLIAIDMPITVKLIIPCSYWYYILHNLIKKGENTSLQFFNREFLRCI